MTLKGYIPELNRSRSFSRPLSVLEEEITGDIYCEDAENMVVVPLDHVQIDKLNETNSEMKVEPEALSRMEFFQVRKYLCF